MCLRKHIDLYVHLKAHNYTSCNYARRRHKIGYWFLCYRILTSFSVQFNCSVVSNSLWPCGLQHTSLPCPLLSPEFTQTHVHWVSDAIQPSHPLLSPSLSINLSQHQGIFHGLAIVNNAAMNIEVHISFQISVFTFFYLYT